jgi:hypothetical protein
MFNIAAEILNCRRFVAFERKDGEPSATIGVSNCRDQQFALTV